MHEGILSLMQMAKVSAALSRFHGAGGLYISVLTNPTMGGVAASFASLGDLVFAEPKALIGFAGPRTIKATIKIELPAGFQTSEFLLEHGYIDRIVDRSRLKNEIEKHVPPGSLILSTRYLKQNIDYYTDCYSLNVRQPGLPWGLTIEEAIREVLDSGMEVFVLDNKGKRKAAKFLPVLRENFTLSPVTRWRSEDLGIHTRYVSELEYLNLYRVLPESDR